MTVPNPSNYTLPAGQAIFFNDGSGERHLGNIASMDLGAEVDTLEHLSNLSGEVLVDRVVPIGRKLEFRFELDEVVLENLRYFFSGGDISLRDSGTGSVSDLKLTLVGEDPVSVGSYYQLSSVVVRQFLDYCRRYNGTSYDNNDAEVDTPAGTPFEAMADSGDYLYLGKNTVFRSFYVDLAVPGAYTGFSVSYWNGSSWVSVPNLVDGTSGLSADGVISFTRPADWKKTVVDGTEAYWVRLGCTAATTPATINSIRRNGTEGTDYWVIPGKAGESGRVDGKIVRIDGGIFADGEEVKASFNHVTWSGRVMPLLARGYIEGSARIQIFPKPGLGVRKEYVVPRCQIRPNGAIKLDAKDWETIPLTMTVLADYTNHPDAPYGYLVEYAD